MWDAVAQDLLQAIQDDDMSDIELIGKNNVEVPANRFVLAARSKVLKRMLYGNFREAKSNRISLTEYDACILEAIVEYCCRNEISKFRVYIHRNASSARRLVQLFQAADFLELTGLSQMVAQLVHNLMSRYPALACPVYDESPESTKVSADSKMMIQHRPYVTLPIDPETGGGVSCLSGHKMNQLFANEGINAGELFLFEMLEQWVTHANCTKDELSYTVSECVNYLHLENIEPQALLSTVQASGIVPQSLIVQAITRQALRASQNRVWTLSSRGRNDVERILVEGAGTPNANGIYYRIDGLTTGELYSKREVACGQQHVYTLSITVASDEQVECRLFCSQLLTKESVYRFVKERTLDQSYQPILQVISIEDGRETEDKDARVSASTGLEAKKYTTLHISDGDHFIRAKIRNSAMTLGIRQNTLLKLLEFTRYRPDDEKVAISLKQVSIISHDPGQRFGNPAYCHDMIDEDDEEDSLSPVVTSSDSLPVEHQFCQEMVQQQHPCSKGSGDSRRQDLVELYSCNYPLLEKPVDSKIPSSGWKVDSHGMAPSPRCRWIPAFPKKGISLENTGASKGPAPAPITSIRKHS